MPASKPHGTRSLIKLDLPTMLTTFSGVDAEKIDKGRIWGVNGYLEGMFRNPSLATFQGIGCKKNKNQRKLIKLITRGEEGGK